MRVSKSPLGVGNIIAQWRHLTRDRVFDSFESENRGYTWTSGFFIIYPMGSVVVRVVGGMVRTWQSLATHCVGAASLVYVLSSEFLEMVRGIGDLCVIGEFRDKSDVIR